MAKSNSPSRNTLHKRKGTKIKKQIGIKKAKNITKVVKSDCVGKSKSPLNKDMITIEQIGDRYPVLKDNELVKKFLNVTMTNNQKGRIRQLIKDNLKGTSDVLLPEIINNKIQVILKSSSDLTDADLRKIRILYNMLKSCTKARRSPSPATTPVADKKKVSEELVKDKKKNVKYDEIVKRKDVKKENFFIKMDEAIIKDDKDKLKVKGPKRYVVYVGNLPIEINKQKLLEHFFEFSDYIKDIRIPKRSKDKKTAIAYIELKDEITYELALSKHHSMLNNRRINVLYTTQNKTKITKPEAKGKSAKMVALQKSGKLVGSVPINRKRSYRRKKQKEALAKAQNDTTS